jgi:mycothiol system anti-sigma-R factor
MTCADGSSADCSRALDNLYFFIDHEIDDASCEEIKAHIDHCAPCLEEYDLEIVVKSLVSRCCTEVAPEPLRDKVLGSIRQVQIQLGQAKLTIE